MMWLNVLFRLLIQSILKPYLFKERRRYTPEEEAQAAEQVKLFLAGEIELYEYPILAKWRANKHLTPEEEWVVKMYLLKTGRKEHETLNLPEVMNLDEYYALSKWIERQHLSPEEEKLVKMYFMRARLEKRDHQVD